jgi:murein DD-endopeptidase MepM/ murein hydrolase activator NlpD
MLDFRLNLSKRRWHALLVILLVAGLVLSLDSNKPVLAAPVAEATIITDYRLRADEGFLEEQIQQFLNKQPGPLKSYSETIYAGYNQSAARSLAVFSLTAEVNPKVLLTLLEVKSKLLSSPTPPQSAIDFALGFDKLDRKGFSKQLVAAAGLLSDRWSYYDVKTTLIFKDGSTAPASTLINRGTYAVQATLAFTTDPATWQNQAGLTDGSFYQTYKTFFGDPLSPDPRPAGAGQTAPAPFLARPFNPAGLSLPGDVDGKGHRNNAPGAPASDGLDYNSPLDAGINNYFDHEYPSNLAGTPGNPPDNAAPAIFLAYRGREVPNSPTWERGYSGHNGIDFNLAAGTPILAAASGRVVSADWGGCGKTVILDHNNGYRTLYLHLDGNDNVGLGQEVGQGHVVGKVGHLNCTPPHLHFGVQFNFQHIDPFGFCPNTVQADPWEAKSGAKSFWLWKEAPSSCAQQHPYTIGVSAQEVAQDYTNLTLGEGGLEAGKVFETKPTPTPDNAISQQVDKPAVTPAALPGGQQSLPQVSGNAAAYLPLINDPDSLVRRSAIDTLGQMGAKEAVPRLLVLLKDPDKLVRGSASRALLALGAKEQTVVTCLALLADGEREVRLGAAAGLRELGDAQTVTALTPLLSNPDPEIRGLADEVRTFLKIKHLALNVALGSKD